MIQKIEENILDLIDRFGDIPEERKILLDQFADFISDLLDEKKEVKLTYICTHNSRRSHMSQIWAVTAAEYFGVKNIKSFSGGTEITAFNQNAVHAVKKYGFSVNKKDEANNPLYLVAYSSNREPIECFSKVYSDKSNPQNDFVAIMTCSQAEENCPIVFGSIKRFSIQYDDPKIFDGTEHEEEKYSERFEQIGIETLYAFSRIRK